MRPVALLLAVVILVAVGCSSPTAEPTELRPVDKRASNQWMCPTESGFVIHTGSEPPSPDCEPYGGQ